MDGGNASVLTIAVVVTRATHAVDPERELRGWQDVFLVAAFIVPAFAIRINMFASRRAVADRLFGAIALYLLLGVVWVIVYALAATTVPHTFPARSLLEPLSSIGATHHGPGAIRTGLTKVGASSSKAKRASSTTSGSSNTSRYNARRREMA